MTHEVENNPHLWVMNLPERCRLIRDFSGALVNESRSTRSHEHADEEFVDEEEFKRESAALQRLVATLTYSGTLLEWAQKGTNIVAETMQSGMPAGDLRQTWKRANENHRLAIISDFLHTQSETLGDSLGFSIPQPALRYMRGGRPSTIGMIRPNFKEISRALFPAVEIRRHLVRDDDPVPALETAYHEGVHYAILVLAARFLCKGLRASNPFYDDAWMQAEKLRHNAIVPSEAYEAYRAQPEEEICFGEEKRLNMLWLGL